MPRFDGRPWSEITAGASDGWGGIGWLGRKDGGKRRRSKYR